MKQFFRYPHIALGGTFDRLHIGHKKLLSVAASLSDRLTIGLTTTSLTQSKQFADVILDYQSREAELATYCQATYPNHTITITPLKDPYGPTTKPTDISALVVTPHTLNGAKAINELRVTNGLIVLPIHVAPLITDDQGEYISSTRIRSGCIDRQGRIYENLFQKDQIMSRQQLTILKKPLGKLETSKKKTIESIKHLKNLYVVGDVVAKLVLTHQVPYHHLVFDGKTKRHPTRIPIDTITHQVINQPGTIGSQATKTICQLIQTNKTSHIHVSGEEDLLVLPYILNAPLGSGVLYGQPDQGAVIVKITEEAKQLAAKILHG